MTTRHSRNRPGGSTEGRRSGRPRYYTRRLVCAFCADKNQVIDYKDVVKLRRYVSERAKIEPRRRTGACAKHQRAISIAIKRARYLALFPLSPRHAFPVGPAKQPAGPVATPAPSAERPVEPKDQPPEPVEALKESEGELAESVEQQEQPQS